MRVRCVYYFLLKEFSAKLFETFCVYYANTYILVLCYNYCVFTTIIYCYCAISNNMAYY